MKSTSSTQEHATRALGPYDGPRNLQVGRSILPTRYAKLNSWPAITAAIAKDLLVLRRRAPQIFSAIAHSTSDAVEVLRRQDRYHRRHSLLEEDSPAAAANAEAAMEARLRLRELIERAADPALLDLCAQGYSGAEIGRMLGLKPHRVNRALRELRENLVDA